jgi:predicted dehydrogenase
VHGTAGELAFDEHRISLWRFGNSDVEHIELGPEPGGHGGGDTRVMRTWLEAIRSGDPSQVPTPAAESLKTHAMVFAAEQSRAEGRIVALAELGV